MRNVLPSNQFSHKQVMEMYDRQFKPPTTFDLPTVPAMQQPPSFQNVATEMQSLRVDNDRLRQEVVSLRNENEDLKERIVVLERRMIEMREVL